MSIKRHTEDTAAYKGSVEMGVYSKGKKHKRYTTNAGTLELFTYLCNCLAARLNPNITIDIEDRPGTLALLKSDTSGERILSYNLPASDISIEQRASDFDPKCSITFFFLIPGTAILNQAVQKVELRSVKGDKIFAIASFADAITVRDIDTNIYVEGTLTISNR